MNRKFPRDRNEPEYGDDGWDPDYPRSKFLRSCYQWHRELYGEEF